MTLDPLQIDVQVNVKDQNLKAKLNLDIAQSQVQLASLKKELKTVTDTPQKIKVQADINQAQTQIKNLKTEMKSMDQNWLQRNLWWLWTSLLSTAWIGMWIAWAFQAVQWFFQWAVWEVMDYQKNLAQLEAVIKSTGWASWYTSKEMMDMANTMQFTNGIVDDSINVAQNMLLTFTEIKGKTFPQATQAVLDMATAMNWGLTPSEEQLSTTSIRLWKALNDPIKWVSALHKVWVAFSDVQKEQIKDFMKANDVASAQQVILAELNKEFGGSAQAQMWTYAWQVAMLNIQRKEFQQTVWGFIVPIMDTMLTKINVMIGAMAWLWDNIRSLWWLWGMLDKTWLTLKAVITWTPLTAAEQERYKLVTPIKTTNNPMNWPVWKWTPYSMQSWGGWWGWSSAASKAKQELKDIDTQAQKNITTTADYTKKIEDLEKKFDDLKATAMEDLADINNQMKEVSLKLTEDLAKRYADVTAELEKWWLTTEEYNKLIEEKTYIEWKDTKAVLDKALAYSRLTEAQQMVADSDKGMAILKEKAGIAKSFSNGKATAKLTDGWIVWTYVDEAWATKDIVDFKNAQYALDLQNKQQALKEDQIALAKDMNDKILIEQMTATKKLEINEKYHEQVRKLIEQENTMVDNFLAKLSRMSVAWSSATWNSTTNNTTNYGWITISSSVWLESFKRATK